LTSTQPLSEGEGQEAHPVKATRDLIIFYVNNTDNESIFFDHSRSCIFNLHVDAGSFASFTLFAFV